MSDWSPPVSGLVLRYRYLWSHEAAKLVDAGEARPAAVVVSSVMSNNRWRVIVAPITRSTPRQGDAVLELPLIVKRQLGLDDERSWVVLHEVNSFVWPGPDLEPRFPEGGVLYGRLPQRLTKRIFEEVSRRAEAGQLSIVYRRG